MGPSPAADVLHQESDQPAARVAPNQLDGPSYPVSNFVLRYFHKGHHGHPPRTKLMQLEVVLGQTPQGYVAPRDGIPSVTIRLEDVAERPTKRYYASAVQTILERIRDELSRRQLLGVYVAPDPSDIGEAGQDLRPAQRTALRLLITTAVVTELRTLASGDRIDASERVDNPLHAPILGRSPIQLFAGDDKKRRDLLRKDDLDDFIFRLSRHPGRRVDAAVSAAQDPGGVALDYLITENPPLALYAQLANTGTKQTDRLRERIGLIHNQLTNNDDVLSVDYITTAFDEVNAIIASYEWPLPFSDRLRLRAHGSWSEYTASEVGVFADIFTGDSWSLGAEIIANIVQDRNLFVDLVAGARFESVKVDNKVVSVAGEEEFFMPHIGLRLEQQADWFQISGALVAEWNDASVASLDSSELNRLGRLFPDSDWGVVRWDLGGAFYLEPLVNREAWEDPSTPETSTLAHELVLSFRGQYAFDNRLVPQFEQVIGGLYSVRGYPESVIAGDTVIVGNVEYRYHLPRALAIQPTPAELFGEPFRFAPQNVYGRPDWDLVFRAFCDVGQNIVSDKLSFETEDTLLGAGVGIELVFKRNFNVRLDWGFALRDVDDRDVNAGSNRLHFVATLFF
ncbi:MAG: ShlB/FhaC/HecB family protein [Planctomycetota bacterium]|jgi:hypothetical protein